jgi:hypothetical protein
MEFRLSSLKTRQRRRLNKLRSVGWRPKMNPRGIERHKFAGKVRRVSRPHTRDAQGQCYGGCGYSAKSRTHNLQARIAKGRKPTWA